MSGLIWTSFFLHFPTPGLRPLMTEKVVAHQTFFIPLHYFKKSENSPEDELISFLSSAPQLFDLSWSVPQGAGCVREQSVFIPTSDLHAAHPQQICCHSASGPPLLFCEPSWWHSWNSRISLPQEQESHVSNTWANSTFPPIYYFWHCFPVPQSLTYQDNEQKQHKNIFVFLILPFFSELSLIYSFFFTTNLCSLSSSAANTLKLNSTFPLLCLWGHISTWVMFLIYNMKRLPYIQI